MRITLLVTASIAAYKTPELVRELKKRGHSVRVALSRGAAEFVTPLTLQTVSGEAVATELFDLEQESKIGHISLADSCDVMVVAPATANFIAKATYGIADDLPTTVILATKSPVVIAPAMNVNMWENPVTQQNIALLKNRGLYFVEPESGELACGWQGKGRLAELPLIVAAIEGLRKGNELSGKSYIVTAGPSREALDPIRFITNRSSGKMGAAIAEVARALGAEVHFIYGPGVTPPPGVNCYPFESALDLQSKVKEVIAAQTLPSTLIMAAAPGDFRAPAISPTKLKDDKSKELNLRLVANPDILKSIGDERASYKNLSTVVAFCAESLSGEPLIAAAREKLERKRADFIVANSLESFAGDSTEIILLSREGGSAHSSGKVSKQQAARWLIDLINRG